MLRSCLLAALATCLSACASTGPSMGPGPEPTAIEPQPASATEPLPPTDPDACHRAVKGDSPVARACRQGGVRSAKATMKELVKQGQGAGLRLACDDCHVDGADFSRLSPEAPEKFRNLLATIGRN